MRRFGLSIFLFLCFAVSATAADRRVALVIGNSAYQHTSPLTNPHNDAADVSAALKHHGFEVVEGFDLDKAGMDNKVRAFAEALQGATVGLFFYAGHGLQVAGQNYLMPVDAKLSTAAALDWEMVRLDIVHRSMERAASTNILFVDACRNNPLARNLARALGTRSAEIGRGLAPVESGVGTLVSFSTQPGNVALDGSGRNSPFAAALTRRVLAADGDLGDMLIAVRNDVIKETDSRQVPWEHSAMTGKFYFRNGTPPDASSGGRGHEAASAAQVSEAERAWTAVKDTNDVAVLQAFLDRYGSSFYAALAKARIERASAHAAGVAVPSTQPTAPAAATDPRRAFDGIWSIDRVATTGCLMKRHKFQILIEDGEVPNGKITASNGRAALAFALKNRDGNPIKFSGELKGTSGSGKFVMPVGGPCSGTFTASKQ